jgi:hypothetical protein
MKYWILLVLGFGPAWALADSPATQPDMNDPPVPAAMAPSYIAIGKDLSLRLSLVRRTVDELILDPATKTQVDELLNSCSKEVDDMVSEMTNGPMPSSRKVLGIPVELRGQRNQLYEIIGTQQGQSLDEMLRSLRGEGRSTLGHIELMLQEMTPPPVAMEKCEGIIAAAQEKVERLPHTDLPADQYDSGRESLDGILNSVQQQLGQVLTPGELDRLGPRFTELFPTSK